MNKRIALIGIILDEGSDVQKVNEFLHNYAHMIEGRMGLPRVMGNTNVMSIVVVGSNNDISSLSGKLGQIQGVTTKTIYGKEQA